MKLKSGVKLLSETPGTGEPIKKGDTVKVRLNGWLNQGQQIQENHFCEVVVGSRVLIPGIDYSIHGMRLGGKRKVKISPHLGYRDAAWRISSLRTLCSRTKSKFWKSKRAANTRWSEAENRNNLHSKSQLSGIG